MHAASSGRPASKGAGVSALYLLRLLGDFATLSTACAIWLLTHQTYTFALAIDALTLPPASGGAGTVRYRLTPAIPVVALRGGRALAVRHAERRRHHRATDEKDLSATLKFTVTVIGEIGDSPATATVIRPGSPIRGRSSPGLTPTTSRSRYNPPPA